MPALLSWDRMITGIREGGRPMAALGSGIHCGRSPLAMSPLTSYVRQEAKSRDRACGEPHFHLQVSTRKAGPRALDVPMIRPETGRDDGGGLPSESSARGTPLCPAGHLPLKGGDFQAAPPCSFFAAFQEKARPRRA